MKRIIFATFSVLILLSIGTIRGEPYFNETQLVLAGTIGITNATIGLSYKLSIPSPRIGLYIDGRFPAWFFRSDIIILNGTVEISCYRTEVGKVNSPFWKNVFGEGYNETFKLTKGDRIQSRYLIGAFNLSEWKGFFCFRYKELNGFEIKNLLALGGILTDNPPYDNLENPGWW